MTLFKHIVYGLYFSLLFIIALVVGGFINPDALSETAFSPLGIIIIFASIMFDAIFNLSSVEDKPKVVP